MFTWLSAPLHRNLRPRHRSQEERSRGDDGSAGEVDMALERFWRDNC